MIRKLLTQRCNLKLSDDGFKELCMKTTEFIKNNEIKKGYLIVLDQVLLCMCLIYQKDVMQKIMGGLDLGSVGK